MMFGYVFGLLMLIQTAAAPLPPDEIKDALSRAESLYFEARFNDSIQLLLQVNDRLNKDGLNTRPDRLHDRTAAKLQLALAHIGLNDTDKAKTYLVEMYSLDPSVTLDAQQYSPKVMALANEARTEMEKAQCRTIGDTAQKDLKDGNVTAMLALLGATGNRCVDMAALAPDASDLLYRAGLDAYKRADLSTALQDFQAAVKYSPKNELASQYIELAQGKLQIAEERALIQWQKDFDARQFREAAADFRQIVAFNDSTAPSIQKATEQYRKTLTLLVESWNRSCPSANTAGNAETLNGIRNQIAELLPDPAFAEDIRSRMMSCSKPEPKSEVKPEIKTVALITPATPAAPSVPAAAAGNGSTASSGATPAGLCMQLDYRVAMTRLKTRVEPEIPREGRAVIQGTAVSVRMKVRIDESGTVSKVEPTPGNPMFNNAAKTAVERWKFSTAMDSNGARCVDTEIPFTFGPLTGH